MEKNGAAECKKCGSIELDSNLKCTQCGTENK
jgi:uncharacterized membrane protein YvbJ